MGYGGVCIFFFFKLLLRLLLTRLVLELQMLCQQQSNTKATLRQQSATLRKTLYL